METKFDLEKKNLAYLSKDELLELDSFGRRISCCFYKNENGQVQCQALTDFYNVENRMHQCGKCPFYKTEEEFKEGWGGDFYDEEELEETI